MSKPKERSDDLGSKFRIHCALCGELITNGGRMYCSERCHGLSTTSEGARIRKAERRKYEEFKRRETLRIIKEERESRRRKALYDKQQKLCATCVWKSNGICVMPTCLKRKGIGIVR